MNKLVQLAVVAVALCSLAGCQLCFLGCEVCGLLATGGRAAAIREDKDAPLPEVAPTFASPGTVLAERADVGLSH